MKLKQALVIGLSGAILAIPAFATESTTSTFGSSSAATGQPAAVIAPAKKETTHHKRHKKISMEKKIDPKQSKENAKLDELNTLNSQAAEKDQTEKNSIKS